MGAAVAAATAPKFIFDVGKNLHTVDEIITVPSFNPHYRDAPYMEIIIENEDSYTIPLAFKDMARFITRSGVPLKPIPVLYPRRFTLDESGNLVEVFPFKV